jgi:hypothetical protein
MIWDRHAVSAALVARLGPATGVKIHPIPPELLNPPCVVVSRPQPVMYDTFAFGVDDATLPVLIVGGIETEDAIEQTKTACRTAIMNDSTLGGTVKACTPAEERNWRNLTGAGGIQLLVVELILQIQM